MRKTLPLFTVLSGAALLCPSLHAAPDAYIGPGGGDWNTTSSWSAGVSPNGNNGTFYDVTNSSANTVVHSASLGPNNMGAGSTDTINSLNFTGTGGLTVSGLGDVLAGALPNSASVFSVAGPLLISGGSLSNFTLMNSDAAMFGPATTSGGNTLANMILSGGLTIAGAGVNIGGTFAYGANATFDLSQGGGMEFSINETLANATLKLGASGTEVSGLSVDSSHTLTLDSTLAVSGAWADFVGGPLVSNTLLSSNQGGLWYFNLVESFTNNATTEARYGSLALDAGEVINNGIFQAVNGAAASTSETTLINSGMFQALSGGTLTLSPYRYNANTLGIATASGAGSQLNLAGGTLTLGQGETLSASNGGVINLQTTLSNTGKTFDPLAYGPAGTFVVDNGTISGGTLANSDSQRFAGTTNGLTNVTLSGGLSLAGAAAKVTIQGTFAHAAGALFDLGTAGTLNFSGNETLDSATVNFGSSAAALSISSSTLTLGPNLILQGASGVIGPSPSSINQITNQTTILASGRVSGGARNTFSLQARQVLNQGTLGASSGGSLVVGSTTTLMNSGTVTMTSGSIMSAPLFTQTAGQTTVDGQLTVGTLALQGGTLNGTGTVSGGVSNTGGILRPGDSPGTLAITGAYTQGSGGTFLEQIGGTGTGQSGLLTVGGSATLGGTLDIALVNGFTPTVGQRITFLTDSAQSGTFANVIVLDPGYSYSVVYGQNATTLSVTAAPEPSPLAVFGLGALGLAGFAWRRKRPIRVRGLSSPAPNRERSSEGLSP